MVSIIATIYGGWGSACSQKLMHQKVMVIYYQGDVIIKVPDQNLIKIG